MVLGQRTTGQVLRLVGAVLLLLGASDATAQSRSSAAGARRSAAPEVRTRESATEVRIGAAEPGARRASAMRPASPSAVSPLDIECADQEIIVDLADIQSASTEIPILVNAGQSGWQMALVSQDLTPQSGALIPAESLVALGAQKKWVPLSDTRPLPLVLDGQTGTTRIGVPVRALIPETAPPGDYTGEMTLIAARTFGDPAPQLRRFRFCLRLCQTIEHEFRGTRTYLHFGNTQSGQQFRVEGAIHYTHPVRLILRGEDGPVDALPLTKPFAGGAGAASEPTPLVWRLAAGASGIARPPDAAALDGSWIAWDLVSGECRKDYTLECDVTPAPYQAPGDYNARLRIDVQPLSGHGVPAKAAKNPS